MGVRILSDGENAILYCSTSDWAFGPLFGTDSEDDRTAQERAEAFCRWIDHHYYQFDRYPNIGGERPDPRGLTEDGMGAAYLTWQTSIEPNGGQPCKHDDIETTSGDPSDGETYKTVYGTCRVCGAEMEGMAEIEGGDDDGSPFWVANKDAWEVRT